MRRRGFLTTLVTAPIVAGCADTRRGALLTAKAFGTLFHGMRRLDGKLEHVAADGARLAVTWVGHATTVLQLDDKFILTDPVFTTSVGQFNRRLVEPGVSVDALPPIDAVLISHLHVDHLSLGSLDLLEDKYEQLILPRGGSVYVPNNSVLPLELAPHMSWQHDGLRITAVPVLHRGWRYPLDKPWLRYSYTGYVIEYRGQKVYFGGDTAYHPELFVETGRRLGPFDLVLLPIGPVEPRNVMCRVHLTPTEALNAFEELRGEVMVPIHFDTFHTSFDEVGAAPAELLAGSTRQGFDKANLVVLSHGQRAILSRDPSTRRLVAHIDGARLP